MNKKGHKYLLWGIALVAFAIVLRVALTSEHGSPVDVSVVNISTHGSDCVDLVFTNHTKRVYDISAIAEVKRAGTWREAYRTRLRLDDTLTWDMDKPWQPNAEPEPWRVRLTFQGGLLPREVKIANLLKKVGVKYPFKHTFERQVDVRPRTL